MQQRLFSMVMLWAMFAQVVVFGQEPGLVQVPAKQGDEVEATDVRPSDDFQGAMGIDASRKALMDQFMAWGRQLDVKARVNEELKKNFTGTPKERLQIRLMELVYCEDQTAMGNAIARAAENYRHQCGRVLSRAVQEIKADQATLRRKSKEIDDMLLVLDTGTTPDGRELAEDEMNWAKRRLRTLLNHRGDIYTALEVDKANVRFYRDELVALVKLDRYLDGWASELSAHVERVVDAAERDRKDLELKDVRADRKQIQVFFDIFKNRVQTDQKMMPATKDPVQEAGGVAKALPKEPPLSPEDEKMVEAELEKFRQRRGAKKP